MYFSLDGTLILSLQTYNVCISFITIHFTRNSSLFFKVTVKYWFVSETIYLQEVHVFLGNCTFSSVSSVCRHTCIFVMCVGGIVEEGSTRHSWDIFLPNKNYKYYSFKKNQFWSSHFTEEDLKLRDKSISPFPTFSSSALGIIRLAMIAYLFQAVNLYMARYVFLKVLFSGTQTISHGCSI